MSHCRGAEVARDPRQWALVTMSGTYGGRRNGWKQTISPTSADPGGTIVCMRATINVSDTLAGASASLIGEGLRSVPARAEETAPIEPLPAYGDPHGHALVDLADRDALWSALDTTTV